MPMSDWFKARDAKRYTAADPSGRQPEITDGAWEKCPGCKHVLYAGDLERTDGVCPHCGHHFELEAGERIALLADEGTFAEIDAGLRSGDPLEFTSGKAYAGQYAAAVEKTGMNEAFVAGRCRIEGVPVVLGVMDFRFIGASMGSVVGEKIARAFEAALADGCAVVLVTASGGARMQEGMLSLMQMAKTSAAAERLARAGLPYVAVLANPTYGGVTASFATLADVIVAEPGAMVGFAGPRLVEQTIKQGLPKGFQTAESLVEHGMVDAVVPRAELRDTLALLLGYLAPKGGAS
ncbi:MAG: acetyl-CoA carboxylase carboxyltransferase subunit beta [Actinobacteria bacterium]|nr:MAG: acetyl-CoA carboxylase carboxyltransferase subunit beta [Actinomycetota bacterium]